MSEGKLSTAEQRRPIVAEAALTQFARGGYHGTTVADVAREAGISPAYVFKLFPSKESLFGVALETCFAKVVAAVTSAAARADTTDPDEILEAMGDAYALLIRDRELLMLQVHAQAVAHIPDIGAALRTGIADVVDTAKRLSGAADDAVQRFMAYGQLCHLIVTTGMTDVDDQWARLLTAGMFHP
ncbi:TetR/AcrR family transcriptional regulator [Gordonia humi]|uniref:AcrR family transcriptional regulator n=1 Tax=Gordonia humi TaxID=686429 RepID=A0A840EUP9_9ACTN|nr:TetR/AcrR family transcriptional regulator [Gordonia humi]MBB4134074.1 AcrR family transcriptional regulator [Gordonia humi]